MQDKRALEEWRTGWPLVLTGLVGTMCVGAHVYPLGVMMKPLAVAFGWTRAEISFAASISSMTTLVLATFVGLLLDRFGPRRVALVGTPLAAAVITLAGLAGPALWTWFAVWSLYAPVVLLILPIVWGAAIASHFHVSRGFGLAIGLSGSGLAAAVYPPLTLWLLDTFGLRGVYPGLGLFTLLTLGPLVLFAFKPAATGKAAVTVEAVNPETTWGLTLSQALRTTMLWRIVLVMAVAAVVSSAINVHMQSLLTDGGVSPGTAVSIVAALGPSTLIGRGLGGFFLDRFHARWITAISFLMPAIGCVLLIFFDGIYWRGFLASVLIGFAVGVEGGLLPFLLSRYFGLKAFGAIYGLGMAAFGGGYALGPTAAGFLFDTLGSYDAFLMVTAGALVTAGLVALSYGVYPTQASFEEPSVATGKLVGETP